MFEVNKLARLDKMGRMLIPKTVRDEWDEMYGNNEYSLRLYSQGTRLYIEPVEGVCAFCGNTEDLIDFNGKKVCASCLEELKTLN